MAKPEIEINVKLNDADRERIKKELRELTPEQEFSYGSKDMSNEIRGLIEQYSELAYQTSKVTESYREELASLDENAKGYAENKKELEALIVQGLNLEKTLTSNKLAVEKQIEALQHLSSTTSKIGFQKANEELNKLGSKVGVQAQNYTLLEQRVSNFAETWNNKLLRAQEKSLGIEQKLQAQRELQALTLNELVQLFTELTEARAKASSQEELNAIDAKLTEVRKNIELTSRQTQLSGAQIIGSQTSLQGVFASTLRLWQRGTLTLKGLTQGMKMFAKSTIFLAAIQLAWELLTKVWEKARTALFGTADASEKAAEKQKELAEAAREANKALIAAQDALLMANKDGGKTVEEVIKAQNEAYKEQIELIDKATAAHLRQSAITAKEGEQAVALERLDLQEKLMLGIIDEFEYKEKIIDLDLKAKEQQSKAALEKKEIEQADAEKKAAQAKKELKDAENLKKQYKLAPEKLRVKVDSYKAWKADLDKTKGKISELESERSKLELALKGLNAIGGEYGAPGTRWATKVTKEKLKENDFKLRSLRFDYSTQEQNMLQVYKDIPQFLRQMGMSNESISKYNSEYQKASEQYKTAQAAYNQAQKKADELEEQYNNATEDELRNAEMRQEIADKQKKHLSINKENQKKNEANEKKAQALRDKVNSMTYQELKDEEKDLLDKVSKAGKDSPEGKHWKTLADVYSSERRSRDAESRKAREKVEWTGRDATGKAARIVDDAAKLAGKSVRNDAVDLVALAQLVKQAADTKSLADDAALKQTLKTVESLITTTQASSRKMRNLEKQVARLNRKTAAQL